MFNERMKVVEKFRLAEVQADEQKVRGNGRRHMLNCENGQASRSVISGAGILADGQEVV